MTPESKNSQLLDNGSLTHISMGLRIHGDRLDTERAFYVKGINKQFLWIRASNKHFPCLPRDHKSGSAEKIDSVVVQS
jgi:methionine aminopeptidase